VHQVVCRRDVHKYFNPYDSPYDSYINFMNVLESSSEAVRASGVEGCAVATASQETAACVAATVDMSSLTAHRPVEEIVHLSIPGRASTTCSAGNGC